MKDVYQPRDLVFARAKKIYGEELRGPSLRQMEASMKQKLRREEWIEASSKRGFNEPVREKPRNQDQLATIFDLQERGKLSDMLRDDDLDPLTVELSSQLEKHIR